MTRDEVLREYDYTSIDECTWLERKLVDQVVALRERLAVSEAERDEEIARVVRITERLGNAEFRAERAERILAALREPSLVVWTAAHEAWDKASDKPLSQAIRAAVAAAEQEVDCA